MPPTLPANPRPTPPQQQQPTQGVMDQSSDLNSLLDQKVDDDSPGQAMGDLKGQIDGAGCEDRAPAQAGLRANKGILDGQASWTTAARFS